MNLDYAYQGGALYLQTTLTKGSEIPSTPTFAIYSSVFYKNSARYGGAIYASDVDHLVLQNSTFLNNSATTPDSKIALYGNGGSIYYASTSSTSQLVFSRDNEFRYNTADNSGGALFWNYNQPLNIYNVSFQSNEATLYGNDYACFPQLLKVITQEEYESALPEIRMLEEVALTMNNFTLSNQQSGGDIKPIYLALVDEFGQIVGSDSSSPVILSITDKYNGEYTPILTGTTTHSMNRGVVSFDDLTFTSEPGLSFDFQFYTSAIDLLKPSNVEYLIDNMLTSSALAMTIELRNCILGEQFKSSGACVEWEASTEYSLELMTTVGECKECQLSKMYCKGGADIGPKPGYWRSSVNSDNFISWLHKPAWAGYTEPNFNNLGEWLNGYQGMLWADWKSGFSRTGNFKWAKCPNPILNAIYLCLVLICVVVGVVILIRSTLSSALQRKNLQSIYIKLLMNHVQLIFLTSTFEFEWPGRVKSIFNTTEPVAQVSTQILSIDWFLDQRSSSDEGDSKNAIGLYYQKMVMYAILPFIVALWSFAFWNLYLCKKDKRGSLKRQSRIIASMIILFFLAHPTIVEYMFSNFHCTDIDDEQRVTRDLNVI